MLHWKWVDIKGLEDKKAWEETNILTAQRSADSGRFTCHQREEKHKNKNDFKMCICTIALFHKPLFAESILKPPRASRQRTCFTLQKRLHNPSKENQKSKSWTVCRADWKQPREIDGSTNNNGCSVWPSQRSRGDLHLFGVWRQTVARPQPIGGKEGESRS